MFKFITNLLPEKKSDKQLLSEIKNRLPKGSLHLKNIKSRSQLDYTFSAVCR